MVEKRKLSFREEMISEMFDVGLTEKVGLEIYSTIRLIKSDYENLLKFKDKVNKKFSGSIKAKNFVEYNRHESDEIGWLTKKDGVDGPEFRCDYRMKDVIDEIYKILKDFVDAKEGWNNDKETENNVKEAILKKNSVDTKGIVLKNLFKLYKIDLIWIRRKENNIKVLNDFSNFLVKIKDENNNYGIERSMNFYKRVIDVNEKEKKIFVKISDELKKCFDLLREPTGDIENEAKADGDRILKKQESAKEVVLMNFEYYGK